MRVSLVSTGDEILLGEVLDTNASYAASLLADHGFSIGRHYTVGDNLDELISVFKSALSEADAVICCGGLGPTRDDITAEAAAATSAVDLVVNQDVLEDLKNKFSMLGLKWTDNQERQARIPEGAQVLSNPLGTAPGIIVQMQPAWLFCLPGPPREYKPMLAGPVLAKLIEIRNSRSDSKNTGVRMLRLFGKGEGLVENALGDMAASIPGLSVGFRAAFPEIQIKLRAQGATSQDVETILDQAELAAREKLGDLIFASGDTSLPAALLDLLQAKNMTLAVAESCTGGLVGKLLTDVPGSSATFLLSMVTYINEMKAKLLGVTAETLEHDGAVSAACAKEMAEGVRRLSGADISLAITGIAG
ncbi:MAG: CinA family nicotinamide mononucleotide deamidase-related protein, partial [Deltaproteobacteria bacterium]|nr:CinA family nicotinamide mononucleotide deamidase-related protein [Deltaproteobacteria bacterium]